MPELPEVETVRSIVGPKIEGRRVHGVELADARVVAHPDTDTFCRRLRGAVIGKSGRRGKYLWFGIGDGGRLVVHLRMTGQLLAAPADRPPEKHTRFVGRLSGGMELRFADARRFGRVWLLAKDEPDSLVGLDRLGLEPDDPGLTPEYLERALGRRRSAIKAMLLDQRIVAGIGNIYADEFLFAAGIHPETPCAALRKKDWRELAARIPVVIAAAIEGNRMTPEEYLAGAGQDFHDGDFISVYGHAGTPCPRCGATLKKIAVGGRGTTYCPRCQKRRG